MLLNCPRDCRACSVAGVVYRSQENALAAVGCEIWKTRVARKMGTTERYEVEKTG